MDYKQLGIEEAIAEIARMEADGETGVVVNVAEKLWCGCAPDDAFDETLREEQAMPVFRSAYRARMVDVVFPGDLCVCILEAVPSPIGQRAFRALVQELTGRGVPASAVGSDFYVSAEDGRRKAGSFGVVRLPNGMQETTLHLSIQADMPFIRSFRKDPPEMERVGLGAYGVTAEELLAVLAGLQINTKE